MYEPREDSYLILRHVRDYAKGDVLDMGTGFGILAIEASKYSDSVIGADIDKELINESNKRYNKKIKNLKFIYSNLFSYFSKNYISYNIIKFEGHSTLKCGVCPSRILGHKEIKDFRCAKNAKHFLACKEMLAFLAQEKHSFSLCQKRRISCLKAGVLPFLCIKNKKFMIKQIGYRNKKYNKFDLIIFNPPYLPEDKNIKDKTIYGGKKGYELIERFLNDSKRYLKRDGKILLLFSSITNKNKINEMIEKNNIKYKLIDKKRIFFEELYVYLIHR